MNQKKKNDNMFAVSLIIFIFIAFFIFLLFRSCNPITDSSGVNWSGNQILTRTTSDDKYIAIYGFNELYFQKDQTNQLVNFYNPKENECYMDMKLMVDDVVLWEEHNIYPNYGFYEININEPLPEGVYNAILAIDCYTMDNDQKVNGSIIEFSLIVS